jgi:hypothetical protein
VHLASGVIAAPADALGVILAKAVRRTIIGRRAEEGLLLV